MSDLAGQDAISHGNDPNKAIAAVRRFLASKSATPPRGAKSICNRYERMSSEMPDLARALDLELREVLSFDYLPEFITLAVEWIAAHGS